ncbi:MAG: rhomboid family intramembrane serine protease [Gammaproteobacteria bacterium]|nr:rhomboid family intramembrane serine protease [Chromatiales bacterium]MDP6674022.1 rhomboid family intramembrane serine protease [Gammaproteobacteria bacterium]
MFPIRDDNPHFLTPYVTYAIIGLNLLAWALLQGLGGEPKLAMSVCTLGLIPGDLLNTVPAGTSFQISPNLWCNITEDSSWHTILTSMFMHGGWLHLLGNMWFMWIFGNNVEDSMGHGRFIVFYLLCGVVAAVFQIMSNTESAVPMVGASGAIGGVMGAYVLLYPRVHVHMFVFLGFFVTTFAMPAMFMIGYWFLLQLVGGVGSIGAHGGGTAFWAHIGGFVAGAVLVIFFKDPKLVARHPYHGWNPQRSPTQSWRRIK